MHDLEIISRYFLTRNIKYYDGDDLVVRDYNSFEEAIVFWKTLLYENYGIRPGSNIAIFDRTIRFSYCTLFFAVAELGARLIVIPDYPVEGTPRTDKMDKFVSVYGRIDLCIIDETDGVTPALLEQTNYYGDATIMKSMINNYEIKDPEVYQHMMNTVFARPDDIFIVTTTSGSTGDPKLVPYTQRQMHNNGRRNVGVFGFCPEDRACHTKNMHHPFVLIDFFLPSLCSIEHHYSIPYISVVEDKTYMARAQQFIVDHKISQMAFSSRNSMEAILDYMVENNLVFEHEYTVIVGGQYVPKNYVEYVKKTRIKKIIANFGSSETMSPLLMKHITQETDIDTYNEHYVGTPPDDEFTYRLNGNRLSVACPRYYEGFKELDDLFEGDPESGFVHLGRENFYRIDHINFKLSDVVAVVKEHFDGKFDICADTKYENLYLAVWEGVVDFDTLNTAMQRRLMIQFRDYAYLNRKQFTNGIKLNQESIRNYFREKK